MSSAPSALETGLPGRGVVSSLRRKKAARVRAVFEPAEAHARWSLPHGLDRASPLDLVGKVARRGCRIVECLRHPVVSGTGFLSSL